MRLLVTLEKREGACALFVQKTPDMKKSESSTQRRKHHTHNVNTFSNFPKAWAGILLSWFPGSSLWEQEKDQKEGVFILTTLKHSEVTSVVTVISVFVPVLLFCCCWSSWVSTTLLLLLLLLFILTYIKSVRIKTVVVNDCLLTLPVSVLVLLPQEILGHGSGGGGGGGNSKRFSLSNGGKLMSTTWQYSV